ncbi:MAG: hypothetical protein OXU98_04865, partial [Gammaproteobacteria bacterium]|nr:hypothetical protein [Gammaproteobacteria bacterium]
ARAEHLPDMAGFDDRLGHVIVPIASVAATKLNRDRDRAQKIEPDPRMRRGPGSQIAASVSQPTEH